MSLPFFFNTKKGNFYRFFLFMYVIQHCFICRPLNSTLRRMLGSNSDCRDFGIESTRSHPHSAISLPRSARSHPQLSQISSTLGQMKSHPHSARSHPQLGQLSSTLGQISSTTRLDLIHTRLDRFYTRLDIIHTRLDLIHTRLQLSYTTRLDLIHTRIALIHNSARSQMWLSSL